MKKATIKSKPKQEPNLKDYEQVYKKFKWRDHYGEVEWFKGGKINAAYNAVTRWAARDGEKTALYWEGEGKKGEKGKTRKLSFGELERESNKFANVLKKQGVRKGERVFIFLPRIPETYICFLGILKTGAIAGTLFQAFGQEALKDRLKNSGAKLLITDMELKKRVGLVRKELPQLKKMMVVGRAGRGELSYSREMAKASERFKIKEMRPNEGAFVIYTSGTTGKPKGVVHTHFSILQQHLTAKWVLDLKEEDIYWCTADPGWVTGVSYGILGNWSNRTCSFVYGGRFSAERWYKLIEKYKITVWYTAPTAIRMLMREGKGAAGSYDLSSLRHLCSVGEPLNPEAIWWGLEVFKLPFHDNWWQTETGGICIANYPGMKIKPGSMGKPFPGVEAAVIDAEGRRITSKEGDLALKPGWPAMMKGIWGNKKKYKSYFKRGWYIPGDRVLVDKEGYFWFIGRADDIIKTRGERVGPFEVESVLVEHPGIVEAGVIGKPDPLLGERIKAFVVLVKGYKPKKDFLEEIQQWVKKRLAGHAYPKEIEIRESLPKTRSGKIMRRVLKAQELGLKTGDVSGLEKD